MYLRFVTAVRDEATGAETGLFGIAIDVKWADAAAPDWIRDQITREVDWFNRNLDAPGRLWRRGGAARTGPRCLLVPAGRVGGDRPRPATWAGS